MEQLVMEDKVEQQRLQKEQAKVTAATKVTQSSESAEFRSLSDDAFVLTHTHLAQVQAWWRGCMVRRGLGPFRKTEDNVKDKKKKKKGKKK